MSLSLKELRKTLAQLPWIFRPIMTHRSEEKKSPSRSLTELPRWEGSFLDCYMQGCILCICAIMCIYAHSFWSPHLGQYTKIKVNILYFHLFTICRLYVWYLYIYIYYIFICIHIYLRMQTFATLTTTLLVQSMFYLVQAHSQLQERVGLGEVACLHMPYW